LNCTNSGSGTYAHKNLLVMMIMIIFQKMGHDTCSTPTIRVTSCVCLHIHLHIKPIILWMRPRFSSEQKKPARTCARLGAREPLSISRISLQVWQFAWFGMFLTTLCHIIWWS